MHTTNLFGTVLLCAGLAASASNYTLTDSFNITNFFSEFTFFDGPDPTNGDVTYVPRFAANSDRLAGYVNNEVYLGVDHTNNYTLKEGVGRPSTRVTSNQKWNHALIIADISHMPGSICGVWPSLWTFDSTSGCTWPDCGEIDIIEGVNLMATDTITLHTSEGCTMKQDPSSQMPGNLLNTTNCNQDQGGTGCSTITTDTRGYGDGFNANGGGVYAMQWTSDVIRIFFFPRSAIPSDITAGTPDPSTWGSPTASFVGDSCSIDDHFKDQNIIFNITFCGDWAGEAKSWPTSGCQAKADSCAAYVASHADEYAEAYWSIKSVKVYQDDSPEGVFAPTAARRAVPTAFSV